MAFVWPLISKAMKQRPLAICMQNLNLIGLEMAETPLMATLAFVVWSLIHMALSLKGLWQKLSPKGGMGTVRFSFTARPAPP